MGKTSSLIAQSGDWSKSDRTNVFEECMSETSKYKNLTKEQQESLGMCYLDEVTNKYSKKEYEAKIEVEINRIKQATIGLCAKNLGLTLETTKKETQEIKTPSRKVNEGNFTRKDLVGIWQDENSKFYFNEDGTFVMKWVTGESAGGTWYIDQARNIVISEVGTMTIISFDGTNMKYSQTYTVKKNPFAKKETKTEFYNATRVE